MTEYEVKIERMFEKIEAGRLASSKGEVLAWYIDYDMGGERRYWSVQDERDAVWDKEVKEIRERHISDELYKVLREESRE